MTDGGPKYPISKKADKFDTHLADGGESGDVGKQERKERVLAFLVDTGLALPRKPIYRNLRYRGADFSDSSLKNYLAELREEGRVERIDAEALADGKIAVADGDPGYWVATRDGKEYIADVREARQSDIDIGEL